ncbi:hypothetical protein CspeluHIS016_0700160 [Cutaneotrichosporon spelunceum]|uniref:Uncharacterized protein n=1 Tax=Cutaneotrichosporon spelunceum TaxID=1672016 RepID=A0AAD3YDD4_9TREE|nr:hypothetical protein CspeluHIS016_0700160 [Cutaneotrichosporon spelunceum]
MRATALLRKANATKAAAPVPRLTKSAEKRTPFLPRGQAPRPTLASLVSLHHESSTFMRDPSEINVAFESAFRYHTPQFQSYTSFRAAALRSRAEHAPGGLATFAPQSPGGMGARRAVGLGEEDDMPDQSRGVSGVFRPQRTWSRRAEMSERETRVREALFGTWERGESAAPALDGVLDVLGARGMSVEDAAEAWKKRE